MGINFGAPGDRRADNGTLWLEWPSNRGPSPAVKLELNPEDAEFFTHDPTWIEGNGPRWIGASGVSGVSGITLWLTDETSAQASIQERLYNVSLYFTEPEDSKPGERQFDIRIQGQTVSKGFDPIQESKSSKTIDFRRVFGDIERDFDMALSAKIIDFVGLDSVEHSVQIR